MPSTHRSIDDDQRVSRRRVIKGGIWAAAGTVATMVSRNAAADAVTPLDVKRVMSAPINPFPRPRRRVVRLPIK